MAEGLSIQRVRISIHVPRVGDDIYFAHTQPYFGISIHVPRVGDDCRRPAPAAGWPRFLSTSPAWGTTEAARRAILEGGFLSTSPAWGTTLDRLECFPHFGISIHVPRVGDDVLPGRGASQRFLHFYPRPPRGGRPSGFAAPQYPAVDFYPRPPRGGRQMPVVMHRRNRGISIHVPRVGDDTRWNAPCKTCCISIHVPRVGDDRHGDCSGARGLSFLSTSPAWGTTCGPSFQIGNYIFLSTSPAWGTTRVSAWPVSMISRISIHVPRVGDDGHPRLVMLMAKSFLSTSPAWGTTGRAQSRRGCPGHFYPRPPRGGRRQM